MLYFQKQKPKKKLRARLVPVIKFMLLRPGRKLINQGGYPPIHVYYVISGEVDVTLKSFDGVITFKNEKKVSPKII